MVTGVAYSLCGDFALSEDVGQEAFFEAWKNLATLQEPEKFSGWICIIARRRAIDTVRKLKSERVVDSLDRMPFEIQDHQQRTPEAGILQTEESEFVWSMLSRLPEKYREPMVLFYRCEESIRNVAIASGQSESTIRQRLTRGRKMLRGEFTESIRKTLGASAPQAAFAGLVMASLPATTYAAGATTTSVVAGKWAAGKTIATGSVAAAIGGTIFGPLIGLLGGAFGSWMSWKNCEYESQQKLIVRQLLRFIVGLAVFLCLPGLLIAAKLGGLLEGGLIYESLLAALLVSSQALTVFWTLSFNRAYKRLAIEARAAGDRVRPSAQRRQDDVRRLTKVTRADGSVGYDAFRWNAGGWFGSCIGSIAWMAPLSVVSFWFESKASGFVTFACFFAGIAMSVAAWRFRKTLSAYRSFQYMIIVTGFLTIIVFTATQLWANEETREFTEWTPWAWLVLLMFPIISLHFWWIERSFEQTVFEAQVVNRKPQSKRQFEA